MKISIFTTATNPERRGDLYKQAIRCYQDLADEVVVVNGGQEITEHYDIKYVNYKWRKEFDWKFIGQQFQRGYEACTGDWVIHCDLDYIFHERDFGRIKQALKDYPNAPAVSFYKWQFILPDRYNLKSRLIIAVNKAKFGDKIKFDSGGDLCQPSFNGEQLELSDMPQAGVPFYNYEKILKTKDQIIDDVGRMERAYYTRFDSWLYSKDGSDKSAYEGWLRMQYGRLNKPQAFIPLSDHPKYMQETIKNLKPEQFGYDGLGFERNRYIC
jgi:glycosyltransferase involved in cell wall biosynthesis